MSRRVGLRIAGRCTADGEDIATARCGGFALLTLLLCVATSAIGAPPAAAASVPFNPAQPTIFIAQGTTTQLNSATQQRRHDQLHPGRQPNRQFDVQRDRLRHVQQLHLRRPVDGSANGASLGSILKIAADGSITYTGINVGSAFNIGAFGPTPPPAMTSTWALTGPPDWTWSTSTTATYTPDHQRWAPPVPT